MKIMLLTGVYIDAIVMYKEMRITTWLGRKMEDRSGDKVKESSL